MVVVVVVTTRIELIEGITGTRFYERAFVRSAEQSRWRGWWLSGCCYRGSVAGGAGGF
jgi:hypothetical protein